MHLAVSRPLAYDDLQTHMLPERSTIVHLFEWKWKDVADECEKFLGPKGYGGVQISPPSENAILHLDDGSRPWFERYQVVSYQLVTRSGNEEEFLDMTRRCNKAGVRVYADVVVNHMTAGEDTVHGTAGNTADPHTYSYPAVPYERSNFHDACSIKSYNNATQVRNCQLEGLRDLNQSIPYVRDKIVEYINKLIDLGVAGIRIDAAKHMWPKDLKDIYDRLKDLNTEFGFAPNSRPYIFQEVIDYSLEAVKPYEYIEYGAVTEFKVGSSLTQCFRGLNALKWLANWGEAWNLLPSNRAFVFIDNHDSQRTLPFLNYKEPKAYKAATAFTLAHPYGQARVMSSYSFSNDRQGPPSDDQENLVTPLFNEDNTCYNGWIAEHRWRQIYQMVAFRNVVRGTNVDNWWDNGNNQIGFSRGNKGFIVFNIENYDLNVNLQTGLPPGDYCDVISGERIGNICTGHRVTVGADGRAHIYLSARAEDAVLAIHVGPEHGTEPSVCGNGFPADTRSIHGEVGQNNS